VFNRRVQIELNLDGEQISGHAEDGTGPMAVEKSASVEYGHFRFAWRLA
jgi:hypothetical protein